jgi:hypothetical protein
MAASCTGSGFPAPNNFATAGASAVTASVAARSCMGRYTPITRSRCGTLPHSDSCVSASARISGVALLLRE